MILVTSPDQVIKNIHRYNDNASKFADLMPFARAWYALQTKAGWLLAPSEGHRLSEPRSRRISRER